MGEEEAGADEGGEGDAKEEGLHEEDQHQRPRHQPRHCQCCTLVQTPELYYLNSSSIAVASIELFNRSRVKIKAVTNATRGPMRMTK